MKVSAHVYFCSASYEGRFKSFYSDLASSKVIRNLRDNHILDAIIA